LDATGILPDSTTHDLFQKWAKQCVFLSLWKQGLAAYDELKGIDWEWQSMDGAMTKAPHGLEVSFFLAFDLQSCKENLTVE